MKRISIPSVRPTAKDTNTPDSEFHDNTTNSTATVYRMFHPHLAPERVRRGPATVRNAAIAA